MNRLRLEATLFLALVSAATQLVAQPARVTSIDPAAELNNALRRTGMVRKERTIVVNGQKCEDACCGGAKTCADCIKCRPAQVTKTEQFTDFLHVTRVDIVEVHDLVIDNSHPTELPENVYFDVGRMLNCGQSEISQTFSLSTTITTSQSTTTTTSVTSGTSVTAGLTAKLGNYGSLNTAVTVNTSATLTDGQTKTVSNQITRGQSATLKVKAGNQGRVELVVFQVGAEAPFSGELVVDGPVEANLDGFTKASDRLSVAERTLRVQGVVQATAASESILRFFEKAAAPSDCTNSPQRAAIEHFSSNISAASISTALTPPNQPEDRAAGVVDWRARATRLRPEWSNRIRKEPRAKLSAEEIKKKFAGQIVIAGSPGDICYIAACDFPYNGFREICYFDDDGACTMCGPEYDPVCDVELPMAKVPPTKVPPAKP